MGGSQTIAGLPGILARDSTGEMVTGSTVAPVNMTIAPPADLDEFYDTAVELGVPKTALTVSFEHSRGCEWEHRTKGELRGCTFCGLYRNSPITVESR